MGVNRKFGFTQNGKFCWDLSNAISGGNGLFRWDCVFPGGTLYPSVNYVYYICRYIFVFLYQYCIVLYQQNIVYSFLKKSINLLNNDIFKLYLSIYLSVYILIYSFFQKIMHNTLYVYDNIEILNIS